MMKDSWTFWSSLYIYRCGSRLVSQNLIGWSDFETLASCISISYALYRHMI